MIAGNAILPRDLGGRIAMCGGKRAYSPFRAFAVAKQMNRKREVRPKVQPYRCAVCNQYHVGGKSL